MNGFRWIYLVIGILCLYACKQAPKAEQQSIEMPAGATPVPVQISDMNCFAERGQFFVTGVCNNTPKKMLKELSKELLTKIQVTIKKYFLKVMPLME